MKTLLRKRAARDPDVFHFVRRYQRCDARHGCSRVRELARLWWHAHSPRHPAEPGPPRESIPTR